MRVNLFSFVRCAGRAPTPHASSFAQQSLRSHLRAGWILALALLGALGGAVQAQFTFATNQGTLTLTGYTGSGGVVIIPETVNGLPVVAIGDWAFYNCAALG